VIAVTGWSIYDGGKPCPWARAQPGQRLDDQREPVDEVVAGGWKARERSWSVIWPGARETFSGPSEFSAETLPLMSLLFRDQMLDALLAQVERMSNTPLPLAKRAERMKVLEEEVDRLQRVEEVLIAREGAERSTNCSPAAVLGVRVTDAHDVRTA
jgi:hypothetical protein